MIDQVRQLAGQGLSATAIGREIGTDARKVRRLADRHGIELTKERRYGNPRRWTAAEDQIIRDHYPHVECVEVAAMLKRPTSATYARAVRLKIKKTQEFYLRRSVIGPESSYRRIGEWRIHNGHLERKIARNKWMGAPYHIWVAHHGQVPAGMVAVWREGMATTNPDDLSIDRVELVTRAEMMRRNSLHTRYPKEITRVMQLRGSLKRTINNRLKKYGEEQSN